MAGLQKLSQHFIFFRRSCVIILQEPEIFSVLPHSRRMAEQISVSCRSQVSRLSLSPSMCRDGVSEKSNAARTNPFFRKASSICPCRFKRHKTTRQVCPGSWSYDLNFHPIGQVFKELPHLSFIPRAGPVCQKEVPYSGCPGHVQEYRQPSTA